MRSRKAVIEKMLGGDVKLENEVNVLNTTKPGINSTIEDSRDESDDEATEADDV